MGSECDLGAAGVAFMPHGVEQETMMLRSRETEVKLSVGGGLPILSTCLNPAVPAAHWIRPPRESTHPLCSFHRISVTGN